MQEEYHLYKGDIFYFTGAPGESKDAYEYIPNGALVIAEGKILETAPYELLKAKYPSIRETDYSGHLLMPGLIDAHVHYSQTEIIGMYGKQLLDWLNGYTFPAEQGFSSAEHAVYIARAFVHDLLQNGTTTCVAYPTTHPTSVNALFQVASEYNMRLITGKVLMDRNAPEGLTDKSTRGEKESRDLIERWHGTGRNSYAITPRFAITSSPEQLKMAARLHAEYPNTYIQTHLSENREEIVSTLNLYAGLSDYLEVYERAGLITDRTLLGHGIHLSDSELKRLAAAKAIIAHCPTSNLFLGSGLFDMQRANEAGVQTVLATDVGAGTSFSMFKTMAEAYKVQQTTGYPIPVLETFYKSTLGTAKALKLDHKIGSFRPEMEADFIVVNCAVTPTQQLRRDYLVRTGKWTIENQLFGLQTLGDDRNITATYLMGQKVR
jgi:guanine deaminase